MLHTNVPFQRSNDANCFFLSTKKMSIIRLLDNVLLKFYYFNIRLNIFERIDKLDIGHIFYRCFLVN